MSQLNKAVDLSGDYRMTLPNHRDYSNTSAMSFNKNLTALGYSTIEPMATHQYSSGDGILPRSYEVGPSLQQRSLIHMEVGPEIGGNSGGEHFGYSALFGPNDFQPQIHGSNHITNRQNESRVNFRDRYEPGSTMSTTKHGIEERHREGDDTRENSRLHGNLKSSMKYSKPPCLQNTSTFGLSITGRHNTTAGAHGTNHTVHMHGDHDDLRLKLDKVAAIFLEKNKEKDAFRDTFFDTEVYDEELRARNYFKLSLDLLKYSLHSANQPKKKVEKKAGGVGMRR